jgi:hypothetical protein
MGTTGSSLPVKVRYISTDEGIIVWLGGRHRTVGVQDAQFNAFHIALTNGAEEHELLDLLNGSSEKMQVALQATDLRVVDGSVTFKGQLLPASISRRLQTMLDKGYGLGPLSNFMTRLSEHPAPEMILDTYALLEESDLPLTADGYLIAYAIATPEYADPDTKLHDMRLGRTCEIPRRMFVDELSPPAGLKFYTAAQASSKLAAGKHAMLVQIDPSDVTLASRQKSPRNESFAYLTCRYIVVQEDTQYLTRKDALLAEPVVSIPMMGC